MKTTQKHPTLFPTGFTLTELLVVIVIVAVLATLGYMGTRKMIDAAAKAKATSNVKQLNTLVHQYANDRNGAILHWGRTEATIDGVTKTRNWSHYLLLTLAPELAVDQNYEKSAGDAYAREVAIFADPKALKRGKSQANFATTGHNSWRTFAYNNRIGLPRVEYPGEIPYATGAKFTHQVNSPHKLILFAQKKLESNGVYFSFLQPEDGSKADIDFKLYNGSAMVGFFDGSVAFFKQKEFPSWRAINPGTGKEYTQTEMNEFYFGSATTYAAP